MFIYEASIIHRQDTSLLKGTTTNNSQKWSPPQAMRSDSKADDQIKSSQQTLVENPKNLCVHCKKIHAELEM